VEEREQRVRRHRAADVERRRGVHLLAVVGRQDLARQLVVQAIDHPAEGAFLVVMPHQHAPSARSWDRAATASRAAGTVG
jgi:hypothetical protein